MSAGEMMRTAVPAGMDAASVPVERAMPVAQQRLWMLEQMGAVGKAYHMVRWMHVHGALDRDALGRALDHIMARHESLRTTFHSVNGEPIQRVISAEGSRFQLTEHDLRGHPHAEAERDRLMAEAAEESFDLEHGPLIRGHLIRLPGDHHTLVFPAHHIVCDAWSVGVFDHDLGLLYGAFSQGLPDPLPPLPAAAAISPQAQAEEIGRQADFWKQTLTGAPSLLTVPADRPRPPKQDVSAAFAGIRLDAELTAGLKALSRRHGTTLFMTLLAAWATVLSRLSGQDDVVVGTPTANRKRREVTRLIGFYVNTLAIRVDLSGSPTVAELLARVKARAVEAQRNQDIPFDQVVEFMQPERSAEHSPLFQVLFTWQNAFRDPPGLPGLELGAAGWTQHETALFDLALTLLEADGGIEGRIKYATALFDAPTVRRYAGYLHRVLEGMAADGPTPVDALPMLPADERRAMLEAWNATETDYPAEQRVHGLFQAQAERTPHAVALVYEERSLTYAELNARANRLAHHLIARGVRPGARMAICAERSLEMMVGLLAILKSGAAYVPLDPEYPADRLRYMLDDSAPAALLVHGAPEESFAGSPVPRIDLHADAVDWADAPDTDPEPAGLEPDALAYVIYTSGSTGRPKGVMVEHRSVVNVLRWMHDAFGVEPGSAVLQKTPLSFDASARELYSPMMAGARLVMARPGGHRDPGYLIETVRTAGVDTLHFVPAMLQAFLEHPDAALCTALRRIVCGGQALPTALVRELHARLPGVALHNVYGPTEATVDVTANPAAPDSADALVPIGGPMPNTRMYVVDRAGEPVPVHVAGEILIGGAQVARGYLGRPGLTAERFIPDPFSDAPGARLYRTGDLGRWEPDGSIHFVGRGDFQVKVRGYRIELGEIEARLAEHPGVHGAVVLAREDEPGDTRLAAYYVGDAGVETEALRAHLSAMLPEHMVPAAFVKLEALPLTPNGKVDRAALQAPDSAAYATRGYEAPVGETEQALAEIWSELLGVERVSRDDQFFELGGHSLLALKLVSHMRKRGLRAQAGLLFANPTLVALAAAVGGQAPKPATPAPVIGIPAGCEAITPEMLPLVKLTPAEIAGIVAGVPGGAANAQDIYPLAPLQEGVLFHHLLAAEGDPYLLPILFEVDTRQRVDAFVAALGAIIARHDVLRTAVAWEGLPEPVQVVWRAAPLEVDEVQPDGDGDVAGWLTARFDPAHFRIDVRRAPLMRAVVARDEAHDRWLVLLLRHHLATDHTSAEVLLAELQAHLSGGVEKLPAPRPFRAFVEGARQGVSRADHEAFFMRMLGDVAEPTAPFGLVEMPSADGQMAEARLEIDPALAVRLRERSRAMGVSVASVCHLAWAQVLARASGRDDVVFGTVLFGRMAGGEGAERAMGPFMNTLPVRIPLGGAGAAASVRRAHALLADLLRHEHASLALAQRCSAVRSPTPLFSSLFNYRHGTAERDARSADVRRGLEGIQVLHAEGWTNYPLTLSVDDLGDGFWLTAQARTSIGPDRVCGLMNTALERLMEALDSAPDTAVARIDVLPADERRRVVEEWNATDADYPREHCVHDMFEARAASALDAVALVSGDVRLTYAELNARANRLAHLLRERGVDVDARVAVCAERSVEMVVAVLAVLKAGGAYVPLDPAHPEQRLRSIVDDAAPVLLLAQAPLAARFAGMAVPVIDLAASEMDRRPETNLDGVGVTPGHLAYVVYTSGSTGRPKGVLVEHRGLANLVHWHQDAFGVRPGTRSSSVAAVGFDAAAWEIWPPLCAGASLLLADGSPDPEALLAWWERQDLDVAFLPTPIAELALARGVAISRLKHLLVGGDRLRAVPSEPPPFTLVNNYGPTETTVVATSGAVGPGARPHIGRPIGNARVYVLDGRGEPAPIGVPGELFIGGAGVARGYLGRAGLTAEMFIPDPFGGQPGARLYRTGDRGSWLADGTLDFLGRTDDQVKIRGFRIEPGEIEARLAEHADVRDAVVLARPGAEYDARLVAYFVAPETVDAAELRAWLRDRLPEYMVPSTYVRMDALPLTPNGKLDRAALPAPEGDIQGAPAYEAPVGETEETVARVWAEVLGVQRIGRADRFFDLGGHSLLAIQVISRLRQALEREVALGDLFARPALVDFARGLRTAGEAELPPLDAAPASERTALSFAQQRLWFLEQLGAAGRAYHIAAGLRLRGELNRPALGRALDRIVARHEALRTTFVRVDGQPVQRIASADASAFRVVDHDLRGEADADAELRRLMADEAGAAFSLEHGPLIRGRLVRLADDDHVLLVTMHHIVSDGWSIGVLVRELSALYAAFRRGDADPLPPLRIQYADYSAWQRRWVQGPVLGRQAEYWKAALAGAPEMLELPADHPRPARQDYAGAALTLELDAELTAGLKVLSARRGTTLFMTLLGGWAAVLGRLSGQEDIVIGTPVANRGVPEVEGLVGFFANTLALRMDLSGAPTVAELLDRVKARALDAQQHQDLPFEQVVELAQPSRSLAHTPLFQVMFAWQNAPGDDLHLPGLEVAPVDPATHVTARFDLSLSLREADGRISGRVEYATALFERDTVERWLGYLHAILAAMVAGDEQAVHRLPMLPDAERARLVTEWNQTAAPYPADESVHALFADWVCRTPDAVAVVDGGRAWSYAELNARADGIARHLRERGVPPGGRVAVLMRRSVDLVAAELAVLKAGAAYVPLDASHPPERIAFMVADSGARVVLSQAGEPVPRLPVERIDIDAFDIHGATGDEGRADNVSPSVGDAAAYVMYTSGSTGEPKGVLVPHRAITQLVLSNGFVQLGADDRVALAANPAFDASTMEVWGPLLNGGRVIVITQDVLLDPEAFGGALRDQGVTTLLITPVLFDHYAQVIPGALAGVRHMLTGGDRTDPAAYGRVLREPGGATVYNCYGPTETTCFSIAHRVERAGDGTRTIPIGRPKANTAAYVLDDVGEPVPAGVAGELYVGGDGVALGYLDRPALTAERFIPDPFGGRPGARMYRTGDLARWRADGALEFVGRADFQVKVRGFRIEPGEIEARLCEHPDVREGVVLARKDGTADRRLVAYYVGGESVEPDTLRAYLAERLPEYMLPSAYVRLEALPLSPNGKVDRRSLPAPEGDAFVVRGYAAPVGGTEEALAAIWAAVLGVERVGRWDHFFELGGHSLLAVQVVSRVRQVLGVDVALGDLFTRPTLADFAREMELSARAELPAIVPATRDERTALSFAQQRLWFLEQMGAAGRAYHLPAALRLRGTLNRDALGPALDSIVARHEPLRTTFGQVDGQPEQRIHPAGESGFRLVDHDLRGRDDVDAELRRLMADEAGTGFDLEHGPLIRGRLVRVADDEHVLLVTMHHIVSDGWSVGVLVGEVSALYGAFLRGEPNPLPALPVQYADYAAWQRRWVHGDVLQRQADYWRAALAGAPEVLELPTDRPRPARQDHAGAAMALELDAELTAGLKALSARRGTTLFVTLLAGWATVLSRLSGQPDVVIGTPAANRGRAEIEGLVGFFVNTLALRMDLSSAPTVAELLERARARALDAQQHQDIPFEQVVDLVQPVRSLAHAPLFQVMFAWQNAPLDGIHLPGLTTEPVQAAPQVMAIFDLTLNLREADGRIVGAMEYATALYEPATVERCIGYLRRVLAAMVADDGQRVDLLPLLSDAERAQVIETWNATLRDFPRDRTLHELFAERAARTPHAPAAIFGDDTLSWAELEARASALAAVLRARGVGPEVCVGVCLERSSDMAVALLAILRAGGVWLPLDPKYPHERLGWILGDARARLVLAHQPTIDRLPDDGPAVLAMDSDWEADTPLPLPLDESGAGPDNLAYVIYTSGSTGRPKGVGVQHRAAVNFAVDMAERLALGADDRVLQFASPGFDVVVEEIFPVWLAGGAVVFAGADLLSPQELTREIDRQGVTALELPTAYWQEIVREITAGELDWPAGVRQVWVGGERMSPERLREWAPVDCALVHVFGLTETACTSATLRLEPREDGSRWPNLPIGRATGNARMYVLDTAMQPMPVGAPGELYIGGEGVARGYLGRPALTAERFIPNPFSADAGARLYRTGDRARWVGEGMMEFIGRIDHQAKIRGFRIEPGEVEARLLEHPSIHEAVVIVREDAPGSARLVAYHVGDEDVDGLAAYLAERLPEYMVPSAFVRLDALPLNANGKVDRKALPAPEGGAFIAGAYEAPIGDVERALAAIWAEVLGTEPIGRRDNFFGRGGHSLLAVQVVSRVRQQMGVEVALGELFIRPVLADFAAGLRTAARAELPPIAPADRSGPLALSFAQQRLWFLEQMGSGGGAYHIPASLRLRGELDRAALTGALDAIIARHEALRTTFHTVDGVPVQRIVPAHAFHLTDQDLARHADAEAELHRIVDDEAAAAFDLAAGPLIRGRLIRLADDDHVLLVTMHHIVSDGWSIGVLIQELSAVYAAFHAGDDNPLPPLPVQYADYAASQRRWMDGDVLGRQAAYWKAALAGAPEVLELPADRPRPARQDHAGAVARMEIDEELTAALRALGQRTGTTLFMALLAGWATVLSRLAGQTDLVVGTPAANRGRSEIEGLIGFFVNTLALRVDVSGSPTVAELLGRIKAVALAGQQHQDIPLEQVVEVVQPARSLSHAPLFQVLFAWENTPRTGLELPGLTLSPVGPARGVTARSDLALSLREAGGRITGGVTYATALFDAATVDRWLGYLRRVLGAMAADEGQVMDGLPMMQEAERLQVVDAWNRTEMPVPGDLCIHEMFEAQAERTPHAVAVRHDGRSTTYAELNARANRLAHHLRAHGVGPETRVAVCVERGVEMMVALMATLKAGGAYVPLDPGYPPARLKAMLEDSAPVVLLARGAPAELSMDVGVPVIELADGSSWTDGPDTNPGRAGLRPQHPAYVIYTSGSTGTPKGVVNEHRCVVSQLAWAQRTWSLGADEAVLQHLSFSFDVSVRELFWPLVVGARVVLAPLEGHNDPGVLAETIRRENVTTIHGVPSLLQVFLEHPEAERCTGLRRVMCGGEVLSAGLVRRFHERLPGAALYHMYGPTETTVAVTMRRCGADESEPRIPLGRPVGNTRVYVLDPRGEPVPTGVAGEICIGGRQVARGYLDCPALTAERFVPDAFGGGAGERIYRTGDVGRWLADGTLEFLGRDDGQVKVRGFRVELGEIEARIAEHASIREAVVLARDDAAGGRRLVAWYVGDGDVDAAGLRAYVTERLPAYMVPAAFVRIDALPRTANGKTDRAALPAPEGDAFGRRGYEAPQGDTETALAALWAELLGVERVGRNDHFFEVGGHSLLATRLIVRIREEMDVDLAVRDVFEMPILSTMAEHLLDAQLAQFDPAEVARVGRLESDLPVG